METAEVLEAEQPPEPKKRRNPPRKQIRPAKQAEILQRLHAGEPIDQIARAVNSPRYLVERVRKDFEKIFPELSRIDGYREAKADILDAAQILALKAVARTADNPTLQMHQAASAFKILNDAGRLERGQSTKNIMVFSRIVTTTDE